MRAAKPPTPRTNLNSLLERLGIRSELKHEHLRWPPDVFGICAYVLKLTGAYVEVLREWPPSGPRSSHPKETKWTEWVKDVGKQWRSVAMTRGAIPVQVVDLWEGVLRNGTVDLSEIGKHRDVVAALLQLAAMADEASSGVGIVEPGGGDTFLDRASMYLATTTPTLSPLLSSSILRVFPKQHSPRGGLTLRSLTHHLALHVGGEVAPSWHTLPYSTGRHGINLLVAPWPLAVRPSQFEPAQGQLADMPGNFGFVTFKLEENPKLVAAWIRRLVEAARRLGGRVDGVVFPEASLSIREHESVRSVVLESGAFLIAGVLGDAAEGEQPSNSVVFSAAGNPAPLMELRQNKHHRWRIDRAQIEMYGLGGTLDPQREWWEHIKMGPREVNFVALGEDLSLCCLVCEDLARQDPVSDLVRSVGPNLVVALLMDAPQLRMRWPARYATVLAEDPGSSVLTVTSAGMVNLSRPPAGARPSRSVGLWKDYKSDIVELELPNDADGLLLNLCTETVQEWTADARTDGGVTGYPRLGGVHAIRLPALPVRSLKRKSDKRKTR